MDRVMKEVFHDVNSTGCIIKSLVNELLEFTDSFNVKDATCEERSTLRFLNDLLDNLEDASALIEYYRKPVRAEGKLHKKENGRYALEEDQSIEFLCGSDIEILQESLGVCGYEWVKSKIDTRNGEYYVVNIVNDFELEGARARVRWQ